MKKILLSAVAFLALTLYAWPPPGAAEADGNVFSVAPAPADDRDKNGPLGRPRPNRTPPRPQRKPRNSTVIIQVPPQVQTHTQTRTVITGPITVGREFPAIVMRAPDGDTIIVRAGHNEDIEVRLYGVDCPEWNQPGGPQAAAFTRSLQGRQVMVREMDTDSYGRLVALVSFEGRSVNLDLAILGHAWYYAHYCRSQPVCDQIKAAEAEARAAGRGLWAGRNPLAPWEWRRRN